MKIKRKVEMNLPQLIEWVWDNNVKNERYRCSDSNPYEYVWINENSDVKLDEDMRISKNDNFTVEVEEEVTEDTEFEKLYYTTILSRIVESSCTTIQSSLKHIAVEPIAFYIMNDDLTLTLIWRDGKLVE